MKTIAALSLFVLLCAAVLSALPVHGEAEIYDSVIRLHVLAASDSAEDQADKLAVRDALLPVTAEGLADCTTRDEAAARLEEIDPADDRIADCEARLSGLTDRMAELAARLTAHRKEAAAWRSPHASPAVFGSA